MSLPAWECGLKFDGFLGTVLPENVTPCVGVWIEIGTPEIPTVGNGVTPCVGVWIEIINI